MDGSLAQKLGLCKVCSLFLQFLNWFLQQRLLSNKRFSGKFYLSKFLTECVDGSLAQKLGLCKAFFKYSFGFLFRLISSSKSDLFLIVPLLSSCLCGDLGCTFLPFGFRFFGFWRAFGANHICFFC